ncbi:2-amino-4-hydroxy-6-hydroxymethyldihydropteridin e pyrophosphokinase [Pandoravirus inopinatum]|uniref:2-amino-4-hydroxy-6-hydroxymethyldihydropteridine diphosphokinase n=1 Tax=Pandoravirus inopinatum TaxID=1605721 RepID=A0A0B5J4J5_9VIRU|nr:2-amino-4-hydroxy-6-hydroxymethyldihydropteridin e pyrophosphokinase [Pandoravirus inopinatum]AJF98549.1 2-amino-4-hydroxy-6-hydroxymethyldihydropteridin e pyrophosphokinase [Pandoravirus inopinatum]
MFLNAAVLVESRIVDPHALMYVLQGIEAAMGRAPLGERLRYGPRPIDLDILCYDDGITTVDSDDLVVPHALLRTRSFVLQPLVDIRPDLLIPSGVGAVNGTSATVAQLWEALLAGSNEPLPRRVLPLGAHRVVDLDSIAGHRTPLLMAIVNATPDSFSGDGIHTVVDESASDADAPSPRALVEQTIAHGADVVDVGGYSTRPGHTTVSVEDETRRVMRVVSSIAGIPSDSPKESDDGAHFPRGDNVVLSRDLLLSIDTFRPEVARACIEALAPSHDRRDAVVWINDVMGMRCDPLAMADLLRQHDGVGIVIMHSRGALDAMTRDPVAASDLLAPHPKDNDTDDIITAVACDLLATAAWAEAHGVARWRIVLDPGIGFGKSLADNVALAGGAARLRAAVGGYPVLIGASRKSFLAKATATAADKRARDAGRTVTVDDNGGLSSETRQHASHAVTAIAAWEGAHIVRVHDVIGSRAVLDIAAALANGPAAAD